MHFFIYTVETLSVYVPHLTVSDDEPKEAPRHRGTGYLTSNCLNTTMLLPLSSW